MAAAPGSPTLGRKPGDIVQTIDRGRMGHIGRDLSLTEILVTLFFDAMRLRPDDPDWAGRDRFVLSKGHSSAALYSVPGRAGYFDASLLASFMAPLSPLNGHPNRRQVKGVEANTGPIGQRPAVYGRRCDRRPHLPRRLPLLGGARRRRTAERLELGGGHVAGHQRLDHLTAIVDRNRLLQGARTEETNGLSPLDEKWRAVGWDLCEVDGHDHAALLGAFEAERGGPPRCVIARTIKGKADSAYNNCGVVLCGQSPGMSYCELVGPAISLLSRAASFCAGVDLLVDAGFCCW